MNLQVTKMNKSKKIQKILVWTDKNFYTYLARALIFVKKILRILSTHFLVMSLYNYLIIICSSYPVRV